jgi:sugar/nucleoside kinase (ribokinase family)
MRAVCLGAHVLDVLVRPVDQIPEGQGGVLVEQIRVAPAGAAGGTAVTLAKLGAEAHSAGGVGEDLLGEMLVRMLEDRGVDTAALVRRPEVQTSTSVLPIRENGDRPALHVIGANGGYSLDEVPWDLIESADALHLGGPEFMPEAAPKILEFCREHDVTTSADLLADGWPELLDMIAPALGHVDWFMPNDDQAMKLTGADDVESAARALIERGVGGVAATCGAQGSVVVTAEESVRVPAFETEVVDTSGCGDSYVAGFLRGLHDGMEIEEAARLGSACASLVAQGLGSDAGDFDLDAARHFARSATPLATG